MGFGVLRRVGPLAVVVVMLTACGNLTNDIVTGTVSGTAANGAPVSGAVSVRDANHVTLQPLAVASSSTFRALLTGLAPPFIFRVSGVADGSPVSFVGVIDGPGPMNATPLTHLAVAIAYGGNPETAFSNWGTDNTVSQADVMLAAAQIKDQIQPVLDAFGQGNRDFLTERFDVGPNPTLTVVLNPAPDGEGMDGVFQILKITYQTDPDNENIFTGYTITNTFTGSTFSDDLSLGTAPVLGLPASDLVDTAVPAPPPPEPPPPPPPAPPSTPVIGAPPINVP